MLTKTVDKVMRKNRLISYIHYSVVIKKTAGINKMDKEHIKQAKVLVKQDLNDKYSPE